MSPLPASQVIAARFDELPKLMAMVRAACATAGFGLESCSRVELVLEEAFSNSVRHGFAGRDNGHVWLEWEILPDGLRLVYCDDAAPFDPLASASLPETGRIGGLGRMLIKSLPRRAQYAFDAGRNRLMLEFAP